MLTQPKILGDARVPLSDTVYQTFYNQWKDKTPDELERLQNATLAEIANKNFDAVGFVSYYELIHGNPLPDHCKKWIDTIFGADSEDKICLIEAWRGSWKTTTISITFVSFFIAHHPTTANLVIQANDDSAHFTIRAIADIIEFHPGFELAFPDIVPDQKWGAQGYEVKDKSVDYGDWVMQNSTRKDPTLAGYGIGSSSLIGKHPDGMLLLDDIHDDDNSRSAVEREGIVNKLTSTILPFIVENEDGMVTLPVVVGTPWDTDDAYAYLESTGECKSIYTPIMTRADGLGYNIGKDDMTAGDHTDLYGDWDLTWVERYPVSSIIALRNRSGKRNFHRMYLLDLVTAKETGIKYQLFPSDKIDLTWSTSAGVDYASTIAERWRRSGERSEFAVAIGMRTPMSRLIITDGFAGHIPQREAELKVIQIQNTYKNFVQTAIEMNGKGEEFYSVINRNPTLLLFPFWVGGDSKTNRHERFVAPWLEMGVVMISDADTPFLNKLRRALDDWPNGNLDVIDAVYALLKTVPDLLTVPLTEEEYQESLYQRRNGSRKFTEKWSSVTKRRMRNGEHSL